MINQIYLMQKKLNLKNMKKIIMKKIFGVKLKNMQLK